MTNDELSPITVKFATPTNGFWDGGQKSGGIFEPTCRNADEPTRSYVEWGCWGLNFWFRFPLHFERGVKRGQPMDKVYVMRRARNYLRTHIRKEATIV